MKIEKVNENQIRCTLTKQDLEARKLDLKELAYGSEKAKGLFHDMIEQANYEFGFEVNDIPLMVEAIPLPSESLILLITKVEYPEELDTRFSKFSEPDEEMLYTPDTGATPALPPKGAADILDLFKIENKETDNDKVEMKPQVAVDLTKMFEFSSMEQVERLAHVLDGFYDGQNDLYRGPDKTYFLMVHKSDHSPEEFNKVCNMICEYAKQKQYTPAVGAYFEEHEKKILCGNAIQMMAKL